MTHVGSEALDSLLENLGRAATVELVAFALPHIVLRRDSLKLLLQTGDWEGAGRVAHKTLSSVRLYGSSQFEALLRQVCQQETGVISSAAFQTTLDKEFSSTIKMLEQWLASELA